MAGREKIKIFEYSKDGKFLKEYESISELRNKYFSNDRGKRPLIRKNEYSTLPNGNYISTYRLGRDKIEFLNRRSKSKFINIKKSNSIIECYNLDNIKIATFVDINIASKLTNIPLTTIYHQLNNGKGTPKKDLIFKYRENE